MSSNQKQKQRSKMLSCIPPSIYSMYTTSPSAHALIVAVLCCISRRQTKVRKEEDVLLYQMLRCVRTADVRIHSTLTSHNDGREARDVDDTAVKECTVRSNDQYGSLLARCLLALDHDVHTAGPIGALPQEAQDGWQQPIFARHIEKFCRKLTLI